MTEDQIHQELINILGAENVTNDPVLMAGYSIDLNPFGGRRIPRYVILPETVPEIQEVLKFCNRGKTPLYTRGSGISTMGVSNYPGVIMMDLYPRMRKIWEINEEHRYAVIEPGVTAGELYKATSPRGLRPLTGQYPYTVSLVSNYLETCAASEGVRYSEQEFLQALEVVLPTGEVFNTGSWGVRGCPPIFRTGFACDLTGLFIGARGTLGIVTKASIKLFPLPDHHEMFVINFGDDLKKMHDCVHEITRIVKPAVNFNIDADFAYFALGMAMRILKGSEAYLDNIDQDAHQTFLDLAPSWWGLYIIEGTENEVKSKMADLDPILKKYDFELFPYTSLGPVFQKMIELFALEQITRPGWMEILAYGAARCCGLYWVGGPSQALIKLYPRLKELAREYRLPFHGFLFGEFPEDRCWGYQYLVGYDSSNPEEVDRIHRWYLELSKEFHRAGCFPPRLFFPPGDEVTNFWISQAPEQMEVIYRIKAALDPNNILNPDQLRIIDPQKFSERK